MFQIKDRKIGPGQPTYIIAELSGNHKQNYDNAIELIREAKKAGADAVKLQSYTPDTITLNCDNEYFKIKGTLWDGQTLYDLYKKAYTPWEWYEGLREEAHRLGMDIFSSPFDTTAVDFLESMNVPVYKIASFENTDHILLKRVAQTGKPIIVSTGLSSLEDIETAIHVLRENGTTSIALLKCTSAYPAKPEDANLANIKDLAKRFNVVTGLSDHTVGVEVSIASVALGGCIIEKHFKLCENSGSEDDAFSLTPKEFKQMVDGVRIVEKAIGKVNYGITMGEEESKPFRRSLFITIDMKKGDIFSEDNIKSIRPGNGLHTRHYWDVLGKKAKNDIKFGTPLSWDLVD
jgi:pseudaminic acid synthase